MKKQTFISWGFFTALALLLVSGLNYTVAQSAPFPLRAALVITKPVNVSLGSKVSQYDLQPSSLYLDQLVSNQINTPNLAAMSLSGPQPYITILCRFADSTGVTPHPKSWYQTLMGSSYPGADHYWREVSYNAINLTGSVVVGWYNLPHPKSYYENHNDRQGIALEECTAVADNDVFFPNFVGISMWFNDTITFGGGATSKVTFLNRDGQNRAYRAIWSSGTDYHGGFVHEMGHSLDLPHTTGIDIMSGWVGSTHPTYGQVAVHINAFHKDLLGWIPAAKKYIVTPGNQATITLERLALPQTNNYLMAQVPINKPDIDFYTIEARHFAGYDQSLDGNEGVSIHKVKMSPCLDLLSFPSEIIPHTVGGRLQWLPGETFTDATNQVTITVNSATATGNVITISYLPNFTRKVYLPLIVDGISAAPEPLLCVRSIKTTDGMGNPKSAFASGESIIYGGDIVNPTPITRMAKLSWSVIGPCGPIFSLSEDTAVESGGVTFPKLQNIPANACTGKYTYTLSVTYNGATSSKSTTFTVTGQ